MVAPGFAISRASRIGWVATGVTSTTISAPWPPVQSDGGDRVPLVGHDSDVGSQAPGEFELVGVPSQACDDDLPRSCHARGHDAAQRTLPAPEDDHRVADPDA